MTVVVGFELGGWDASEFVEESSVVEPVDPFEGGELEVVEAAPWSFVADEFGLVEPVDRLGERIVATIADAADGRQETGLGEAFGVLYRDRAARRDRNGGYT